MSFDLKKGPNIEKNLPAIILDNFRPNILKIINKKLIKRNWKKYLINFILSF